MMELETKFENGGNPPTEVNVMKFIRARAQEIAMTVADAKKKHPKLISQQVPIHMRRRSVSHNVKRLPRRLHEKLTPEADNVQAKKTKRPSRKYRRRPSNLLSEYERRARKNIWLETHIWFAKRFKMIEKWGYKLPLHSNDKSFRASYRAQAKHCLMQDMSYYGCIELFGAETVLIRGLSQLTSPNLGLTFVAKMYMNGTREGNCVVYHPQMYPLKAIGPVSFLWRPQPLNETKPRQIWIWCHPSIYDEMTRVIIALFNLKRETKRASNDPPPAKKSKLDHDGDEVVSDVNKPEAVVKKPPKYIGDQDVEMVLLKDQLVRFRLRGPLSQAVLNDALRLTRTPEVFKSTSAPLWWQRYYQDESNLLATDQQNSLWQRHTRLGSSAELPIGAVLGLVVRDPRFSLPIKRTKAIPDENELLKESDLIEYQPVVSDSPLWDADIRESVKSDMMPTNQVNKLRHEYFEKNGEKLDGLGESESRIPLIIIQNSGVANSVENVRGGCDVILPSGWAMPFWISFVYRQARVGGLREDDSVGIEDGTPVFPDGYPDTTQGKETALERRTELWTKHFKYPPNKRPNFEKLGVLSPFYPLWVDLVYQWSLKLDDANVDHDARMHETRDFYVLRDRKRLKTLNQLLSQMNYDGVDNLIEECVRNQDGLKEALVYVRVKCDKSASASRFAAICLPTEHEITRYKMTNKHVGPVEPSHEIAIAVKEKSKTKEAKSFIENIPEGNGLIDHCSRETIGYVIAGDFSFSNAIKTGNGFCSYVGLLRHARNLAKLKSSKTIALLREQHSVNYQYATIQVPPFCP